MKITQEEQVVARIKEVGFVDRNWALSKYISRLAALMPIIEEKHGKSLVGLHGKEIHGGQVGNYYYVRPSRMHWSCGKYKVENITS
jgi:hypothetical protein